MRTFNHLILLAGAEPSADDQLLLAFAGWMGVSVKRVLIPDGLAFTASCLDEFRPGTSAFAISATMLAALNQTPSADMVLQQLIHRSAALLVFGCKSTSAHAGAIAGLTSGVVSGIIASGEPEARFTFPRQAISLSRQLAGLEFSGRPPNPVSTFELADDTAALVIMAANARPFFVHMTLGSCQAFLSSAPLPDLNEPLEPELELQEHYHRLLPVLIFLRHCFGESCWHGPESTARLIIDDPLITETYGFLDNRVLIESMRRSKYGTSIAFIPWNYWRTSSRNSARLLGADSNLAICVHGCDHTNKEFEALDAALLAQKAGLALQRMESQQQRTGAGFDRVMVFPQGLFSKAAITSLRATNYLAAVNTSCFPTDLGPDHLRVRDFLEPAVTRFNGFPIFQRRYPRRLFDFAFDLFLGKPALLVEHHGYFCDHCKALEEFVARLYIQDAALTWPTLTTQLTRSCLKRKVSDGSAEIRFFTRTFQLQNHEPDSCRFLLTKAEPDPAAIESVLVDGASTPFSIEDGFLKVEVHADPFQVRNVEILDRVPYRQPPIGFGMVHNTGVLLRRGLSEFRDNTLARHSGLLKAARTVARKLKVTGDA